MSVYGNEITRLTVQCKLIVKSIDKFIHIMVYIEQYIYT